MSPTFWPGGASRRTVDACPMCWWLPPPCGCSTGFMATPRTWRGAPLVRAGQRGRAARAARGRAQRRRRRGANCLTPTQSKRSWQCYVVHKEGHRRKRTSGSASAGKLRPEQALCPGAPSAGTPTARPTQGRRTLGQLLRLALYLWYALPAFSMGFSVRPPPATWPTIARHVLGTACRPPRARGQQPGLAGTLLVTRPRACATPLRRGGRSAARLSSQPRAPPRAAPPVLRFRGARDRAAAHLLGAGGHLYAREAGVRVVRHDNRVVPGRARDRAAVAGLLRARPAAHLQPAGRAGCTAAVRAQPARPYPALVADRRINTAAHTQHASAPGSNQPRPCARGPHAYAHAARRPRPAPCRPGARPHLFYIADDGALRHVADRQHVADVQRRLLPRVDELRAQTASRAAPQPALQQQQQKERAEAGYIHRRRLWAGRPGLARSWQRLQAAKLSRRAVRESAAATTRWQFWQLEMLGAALRAAPIAQGRSPGLCADAATRPSARRAPGRCTCPPPR